VKARCTELYHERRDCWQGGKVSDAIEVVARKWTCRASTDYVLEARVMVDSKVVTKSREVYSIEYCGTDTALIRKAIALFDALLESHQWHDALT